MINSEVGVQYHSTLVIKKSGRSDFGQYGCKITNRLGSAEGKIVLERKGMLFVFVENIILKIINKNTFLPESFPLLIVLVGIFSVVIIILILVLVIVVCRKKPCISKPGSSSSEKPMKPNNLDR